MYHSEISYRTLRDHSGISQSTFRAHSENSQRTLTSLAKRNHVPRRAIAIFGTKDSLREKDFIMRRESVREEWYGQK